MGVKVRASPDTVWKVTDGPSTDPGSLLVQGRSVRTRRVLAVDRWHQSSGLRHLLRPALTLEGEALGRSARVRLHPRDQGGRACPARPAALRRAAPLQQSAL